MSLKNGRAAASDHILKMGMDGNEENKVNEELKEEGGVTNPECNEEKLCGEKGASCSTADLRNASYVILFIAAIFVVTAMETGSYRTPWPVAIIVSLAGLGLFGYSLMSEKKS